MRAVLALRRWYQQAGLFALVVGGAGALMAFTTAGVTTYTVIELHRFGRAEARRATFVYAAGQPLAPGISVRAVDLAGTLTRLKYKETAALPATPGHFVEEVRSEPRKPLRTVVGDLDAADLLQRAVRLGAVANQLRRVAVDLIEIGPVRRYPAIAGPAGHGPV